MLPVSWYPYIMFKMIMGGLEAIPANLFIGIVALLFGMVFLLDLIEALDLVGGI